MTEHELNKIREAIKPKPLFEDEQTLFNRLKKKKIGGPWYDYFRRKNEIEAT